MTDIVERLESAAGPSEEIDCLIWQQISPDQSVMLHPGKAFGPGDKFPATYGRLADFPLDGWDDWHSMRLMLDAPPLTGSIDAALSLVERKLPGCCVSVSRGPNHAKRKRKSDGARIPWDAFIANNDLVGTPSHVFALTEAPTPPLAILLALFRALKALEQKATAP